MITNPIGIDKPIQELQQLFIDNLWPDIDASKKVFNHRVFRNLDNQGNLIPEVFIEKFDDYEEVKFEDSLSVLSWFDVAPATSSFDGDQIQQDVGIVFIVNLDALYTALSHRAVEEVHRDARNIIIKRPMSWSIDGLITGIEAYGDFNTENLKRPDMHPWHVFRFNCNLSYTINCK